MSDQNQSHTGIIRRVESAFLDWVNSQSEIQSGVLLAVSGGVDSMVLLYLAQKFLTHFRVAHCNFNLRPGESDLDQECVQDYCHTHQISVEVKSFNTPEILEKESKGVQELARNLRYTFFEELQVKHQLAGVCTAHHSGDKLETVLLNWMRGCGLEGLIPLKQNGQTAFRPLIYLSKADLYQYAKEMDIPFREDQSNATNKYKRNAIRNILIPKWKEVFPLVLPKMVESLNHWENEVGVYHKLLDEKLGLYVSQLPLGRVKLEVPRTMDSDLVNALVLRWLKWRGLKADMLKKAEGAQVGAQFILTDAQMLVKERHSWVLLPKGWEEIALLPFTWKGQHLSGTRELNAEITIRAWKEGDSIRINGQTKKMSNYLNELKIPTHLKKKWPLIMSGDKGLKVLGFAKLSDLAKKENKSVLVGVELSEDFLT
ncbi:MAG: tRNA(Ile)-lysidine synthase [Sphingobacteriales bacterium]|jgi:tRNA(Ile)-lysidine synthase